jgi:hypothetical protein
MPIEGGKRVATYPVSFRSSLPDVGWRAFPSAQLPSSGNRGSPRRTIGLRLHSTSSDTTPPRSPADLEVLPTCSNGI